MSAVRKSRPESAGSRPGQARTDPASRPEPVQPVAPGADHDVGLTSPARALQAQLRREFSVHPAPVWSRFVTPFLALLVVNAWLVGQTLYTPGVINTLGVIG